MKKQIQLLAIIGACNVACLCASSAWGQDSRFYFQGDLGGDWTKDIDLNSFFGPVAGGSKVQLDPGLRAGIVFGYHLTDWFAPEAEVGYLGNQISSISGALLVDDATFANVPMLLNAKFQWPNRSLFTPYIGAGVGFSTSVLDAENITLNGTTVTGSQADVVFAYQAFAGLRCKLNERMGLSLEYRYFVADAPEWEGETFFGPLPTSNTIRFGRAQTQAISVAFDFRF